MSSISFNNGTALTGGGNTFDPSLVPASIQQTVKNYNSLSLLLVDDDWGNGGIKVGDVLSIRGVEVLVTQGMMDEVPNISDFGSTVSNFDLTYGYGGNPELVEGIESSASPHGFAIDDILAFDDHPGEKSMYYIVTEDNVGGDNTKFRARNASDLITGFNILEENRPFTGTITRNGSEVFKTVFKKPFLQAFSFLDHRHAFRHYQGQRDSLDAAKLPVNMPSVFVRAFEPSSNVVADYFKGINKKLLSMSNGHSDAWITIDNDKGLTQAQRQAIGIDDTDPSQLKVGSWSSMQEFVAAINAIETAGLSQNNYKIEITSIILTPTISPVIPNTDLIIDISKAAGDFEEFELTFSSTSKLNGLEVRNKTEKFDSDRFKARFIVSSGHEIKDIYMGGFNLSLNLDGLPNISGSRFTFRGNNTSKSEVELKGNFNSADARVDNAQLEFNGDISNINFYTLENIRTDNRESSFASFNFTNVTYSNNLGITFNLDTYKEFYNVRASRVLLKSMALFKKYLSVPDGIIEPLLNAAPIDMYDEFKVAKSYERNYKKIIDVPNGSTNWLVEADKYESSTIISKGAGQANVYLPQLDEIVADSFGNNWLLADGYRLVFVIGDDTSTMRVYPTTQQSNSALSITGSSTKIAVSNSDGTQSDGADPYAGDHTDNTVGYLESAQKGATVTLRFDSDDFTWRVENMVGNWTLDTV